MNVSDTRHQENKEHTITCKARFKVTELRMNAPQLQYGWLYKYNNASYPWRHSAVENLVYKQDKFNSKMRNNKNEILPEIQLLRDDRVACYPTEWSE